MQAVDPYAGSAVSGEWPDPDHRISGNMLALPHSAVTPVENLRERNGASSSLWRDLPVGVTVDGVLRSAKKASDPTQHNGLYADRFRKMRENRPLHVTKSAQTGIAAMIGMDDGPTCS
jgi:hypothetical protein